MNSRLSFVTILSAGWLWTLLVLAAADAKAPFSVSARKEERPWIWASPRSTAIPAVTNTAWPLSPVDHFILARLEQKGLAPAAPVDDQTWLRRVHFGITGLPPTRDDVREFLSDTNPGARERAVERLLSSPHFGERWARHWMDLVRYAESRGHEGDYQIANAWQYRDYLIRAFNQDVPYDRFLQEHLAGDLLPQPRLRPGTDIHESVLGTGWAFLGEEVHSPVDIRQDECDRLDNKVDVFTKTFMGLTVSCARCHDHKFDPIRTQDYYALTGFLQGASYRQVRFESMENNRQMAGELRALRTSMLPQLAAGYAAAVGPALPEIPRYLAAAGDLIAAPPADLAASIADRARQDSLDPVRLQRWTDHLQSAATNQGQALMRFADSARRGLAASDRNTNPTNASPLRPPPDALRLLADFTEPGRQPWKADGEVFGTGPLSAGDLIAGSDPSHPVARVMTYGAARRDPFWNGLAQSAGNEDDSGRLAATARSGRMLRTPSFSLGSGRLHYLIRGKARVYAAVDAHIMLEGPLHGVLTKTFDTGAATEPQWVSHDLSPYAGHRTHVEFGPDGDAGLEVLMAVESAEVPVWKPLPGAYEPETQVRSLAEFAGRFALVANRACDWLKHPTDLPAEERDRILTVANWLVQNPDLLQVTLDAAARDQVTAFLGAEKAIAGRVQWTSHTAVAWFDGTGVDEYVLVRGKPSKTGDLAPRSLPVAFPSAHPITDRESSGRLELAQQLSDPENPLVARVLVNRVWHHLFGRGIVPTVDNFGALGEAPTHPELLDHLAWQWVHEDHWSLKRLIQRLVLTQTYSMSHRPADARASEVDPNNALWHCVPVRRLEAEAIRDSLLTVSGRLNPAVGGPPVPVHLTEFIIGRGRPEKSGPLDGDGRRSLYLAVKRNFLPTTLLAFDAPTPFSTVGRRNVTNVPAQSLALMNDPLFAEQARIWAERLLREVPAGDPSNRIRWLFETAYGRPPTEAETAACLESLAELRPLQASGDDTALWTDLCHALLNANDFIYVM
jgi:hypothetical protein